MALVLPENGGSPGGRRRGALNRTSIQTVGMGHGSEPGGEKRVEDRKTIMSACIPVVVHIDKF